MEAGVERNTWSIRSHRHCDGVGRSTGGL